MICDVVDGVITSYLLNMSVFIQQKLLGDTGVEISLLLR